MIGSFPFNIGSISLIISNYTIINKWFKGNKITFACNILTTSLRLYEILSNWLTIQLYEINNSI